MTATETQAAVAAFIARKGITHCPTACAGRTTGSVSVADREALAAHHAALNAKADGAEIVPPTFAARTAWVA